MRVGSLLLGLLCLSWVSTHVQASANQQDSGTADKLDQVLSKIEDKVSRMETLRAEFVQEKRLAILDEPIVLKGTLFMEKPNLFAWHVEHPLRYSMVIDGEVIRQWDEDTEQIQKISLAKNPAFKMVIRQLRDWFSGSYRPMLAEYTISVLHNDPITLEFVPLDNAIARQVIERVIITFQEGERYIQQIEIVEKGGDRTLLKFIDILLNAPVAPSAWEVRG
jgi:outer membrane lipoprotein-sorting protein